MRQTNRRMHESNHGNSGFLFHPPDTTVDENRPGYGGTCYSNFEADQTVKVTVYNSASVTATIDWVASGTTDQAYAHPIDGYQLAVATSTSSSSVESVAATQSASPTSSAVSIRLLVMHYIKPITNRPL